MPKSVIKIWWKDELPLQKDYGEALRYLSTHDEKVDYIVTHEAPADYLYRKGYSAYELPDFLLNIKETVDYKSWYCGHHHKDTGYGRVRILQGFQTKGTITFTELQE